jgi:excinuclease ABC subunit A
VPLPLQSLTPEAIVQQALDQYAGKSISVLAPLIRDRKGQHREVLDGLKRRGLIRARVDGEIVRIEEAPELERYVRHTIEAVVDRLRPDREQPSRLREAVESALELSGGDVIFAPAEEAGEERAWSTSRTCPGCGADTPPLEPRLFSFNSPHGACPGCQGLGVRQQVSEVRLIRDSALTIREGALAVTSKSAASRSTIPPSIPISSSRSPRPSASISTRRGRNCRARRRKSCCTAVASNASRTISPGAARNTRAP